ncbi:PREDICTED: nuclear cap-binding protein subunit 3-like [Polistes dominula]|uniref:Nuclear cap-binding protein subunit 3 n=1 Tax=Polistes dominula TaxID=743375 RepID=A0ABM1I2H8_POLDO|nr:PREDICTED: nuclear cap-binding protein subunit 3-like [Polistes dominula]
MEVTEELVDVEMTLEQESGTNDFLEASGKLNHLNNSNTSEFSESRYENRAGTFTTGIDIFSKEEKLKMVERAKRFGLTKNNLSNYEQDLYTSMGIGEDNENTRNIRLNVIHMRGTEDMSTKDVFKYFEDYAPASIEWINDVSCNVVWLDNASAARAMLGLSKRIVGITDKPLNNKNNMNTTVDSVVNEDCIMEVEYDSSSDKEVDEKKNTNEINIKDIDYPLPPGIWRKGVDCPKSRRIFLRFANRSDKKQPNAEKMSEYYKKHGNPNFGGIKGLLTESRKRKLKQIKQNRKKLSEGEEEGEGEEVATATATAVEEEEENGTFGNRMKNPWGALSQSWGINDSVENDFIVKNNYKDSGRNIKERLGIKFPSKSTARVEESNSSANESDSEEEWCTKSKVLRMRMHADDEEKKIHKRRAKLKTQMLLNSMTSGNDLRLRLGRAPIKPTRFPEAIQVVVTNNNATRLNSSKPSDSEEEDGEIVDDIQVEEKEEGEWQDTEEEENTEGEGKEENEIDSEDSDLEAKEVQGPKGSVIKVVQHKPRVASTVWSRLNSVKSVINSSSLKERQQRGRDLRETLKSGDLRSRIGNHTRGRSQLRIEVKNDKYTEDGNDFK